MHARPSTYFSNTVKRPDTPPDSPRASARMSSEQRGLHNHVSEKSLRRQPSASSQVSHVSRGLTKRKSVRIQPDTGTEPRQDRLNLERVDTNASQVSSIRLPGGVRSYNIPNAIVAPAFRLARVVSIPNIDEGSALTTPIPFPIRTQSIPEYRSTSIQSQNSIIPIQKVKVSRSIRSFFKAGFGNPGQSIASEFDDNSSEEGDRNAKGSKKSMFNLRKSKVKETEDRSLLYEIEPPRPSTSLPQGLCTRWCGVPRCFHDCDVLHIKNSHGHDCLVIEMVLGTPTVIAGSLEGLLLELCAPINDRSDPTFTERFLRTCGNFCSPIAILRMLTEQHERNCEPQYQRRVVEIIIRWLRIQPEDLFEGDKLSAVLTTFVREINQYSYHTWNQELQSTCEKVAKKVEMYLEQCKHRDHYELAALVEEAVQSYDSDIMEIDTDDLAKYFAALDLILFRDASENRTVRAWFRRSVDSSLKTSEDPILVDRVARVLHRAEMVKDWISYELLMAPNTKLAAIYIEKFILLAKTLFVLGNFQTSLSIVDSITSVSLEDVHDVWEGVSAERLNMLEELRRLKTDHGYSKALSEACVPVVPCLNRFLDQIEKAEAGMTYYQDHGSKKRHMDLSIDRCGYTHFPGGYTFPTSTSPTQDPPPIYDIAKHGLFYHHIHLARQKAWRAHNFDRLSRQAWIFSVHVPGRSAFCKTTLGEKPNRDSNLTQESLTPKHSMIQSRQNSVKGEWRMVGLDHTDPTARRQGRSSDTGKYPPSPPITPPTSTYFESKRISSVNGPGGLDWISELVERRIIEVRAFQCGQFN